jgi:hypothetical protein
MIARVVEFTAILLVENKTRSSATAQYFSCHAEIAFALGDKCTFIAGTVFIFFSLLRRFFLDIDVW